MKITKIDESAYLPESAVERLKTLGEFVRFDDRPDRDEAISRLANTDVAIVEWTAVDREMIESVHKLNSNLKYIVVALTGYEFVDVKAARECGIFVSNIPAYSRQSVAEHVFAMALALIRNIKDADAAVRQGKRDYFEPFMSMELYGRTLGIIGLGSIGTWVAQIGRGFGMKIVAHSRTPKDIPGIKDVSLDELLKVSDIVVVTVDLNEDSRGLLSEEKLKLMKPTASLISIAPPGVFDEAVLATMIQQQELAGVALDIPEEHSPLEHVGKTVLTPGTAWYTQASLDRLAGIMVDNVEAFLRSRPQNLVN